MEKVNKLKQKIKKEKLISILILVFALTIVLGSILMIVGMTTKINVTEYYLGNELYSINTGSISDVIDLLNASLAMEGININFNLFDFFTYAKIADASIEFNNTYFPDYQTFWNGLALARTAIAGFSFIIIACFEIVVIVSTIITKHLLNKKENENVKEINENNQ